MTRPANDPGRSAAERLADFTQRPPSPGTEATKEFSRPSLDTDQTVVMRSDPGFRVGWRGYDRGDVDNYRSRVEADLAAARSAHENVAQAHAQTAERLRAAQADLGRLRASLTNTPSALSDRLREILHLAAQDADQTRADAQSEADQIRSRAGTEAETIVRQARDTAAGIIADARAEQQKLKADVEQVHATARHQLDEARAEATRMRDAAHNELRQLAVEAQRTREREEAEAAARRNEADRQAREQREQAQAAAESARAEMSQQLADLTGQRNETLTTLGRLADELARAMASTAASASAPADPQSATAEPEAAEPEAAEPEAAEPATEEPATEEPATTEPATPRASGRSARPNRSAGSEPRRPSRPAGASDAAAS